MKMRVFAAASIILTVVLVAAISHAAPSCCDPQNSSAPGATLAPGQPTRGTYSRCLATTARCESPGYPCYGQSNRQQLGRAGTTKAGMQPPGRWVSRTLLPHRVVVLCLTTVGPQEESIPRLRPSFVAVGAVEAAEGRWPSFVFGFSTREWPRSVYLESTEHWSTGLPCGPSELLPNNGAQQQSRWLECIAAWSSQGCGDSYLRMMR